MDGRGHVGLVVSLDIFLVYKLRPGAIEVALEKFAIPRVYRGTAGEGAT